MNTQKGFLSLIGLLLTVLVIGGGAYFYTQSDLNLLKVSKNATSTNGTDIIDTAQSLIDEKNKGQCIENTDCRDGEICYFKPGGNVGACVAKMSNEKISVQTNTNVQVGGSCLQDADCATGMCYFEVGGKVGACTGAKANTTINNSLLSSGKLSENDIKNASYNLGDGTLSKLNNGSYKSNNITANVGASAIGDINNDGTEDAVVILQVSGGNSPVSMPFAVINKEGTLQTFKLYPELKTNNLYYGISKVAINSEGVITLNYHPDRFSKVEETVNFKFYDALGKI